MTQSLSNLDVRKTGNIFKPTTYDIDHTEIVRDIQDKGKKSKYGFLLKYDNCILKDLDVLQSEIAVEF